MANRQNSDRRQSAQAERQQSPRQRSPRQQQPQRQRQPQRGADNPNARRNNAKRRARKRRNKILLFIIEIFVLAALLAVLYVVLKGERVEKIKIDEDALQISDTVKENVAMQGYTNIALFGVDSRNGSLGKGNRSDTIMIASVNMDTGDVKLVSVYRDTYLNLGNDTYDKCNAAYAKGGPEQAIIMLNKNLDMNIKDYVTVGFQGLIDVIDALGGVDIDVSEAEIEHLNNYQISMVGTTTDGINFTAEAGVDYQPVTQAGLQRLNGLQATAFCRIRYVGDDFERTRRQQEVLQAITAKVKQSSPGTLNDTVNAVMDQVSTSLDISEILKLLGEVGKYNIVATDGFPFADNRATGRISGKSCVIPKDLEINVKQLHAFLFDAEDYQVSPEVQACSDRIARDTN